MAEASPKPMRTERQRRSMAILGLLLIAGAANGLLAALVHAAGFGTGTYEYRQIAENLAAGHGFVLRPGGEAILWRPPLYIWILAAFYMLPFDPYGLIVAAQILANAMTGVMVMLIGERVFDRRVAAWTALATVLYPLCALNVTRLMPETLFTLLLAAAVWLLIRLLEDSRWRWPLGLGVVLGCACLTKASIQFLPLFLLGWVFVFVRARDRFRRIAGRVLIATGIMLLVISPWTIRNYWVSKEFILIDTSGGYTFWVGNRVATDGLDDDPLDAKGRTEIKQDVARILGVPYTPSFTLAETAWASAKSGNRLYREALRRIVRQPAETAALAARKLGRFWFSYIGGGRTIQRAVVLLQLAVLIPAVAGLAIALRQRRNLLALGAVLCYFPLLHMASTSNVRYSVPVMPYALMLAVFALISLRNTRVGKRPAPPANPPAHRAGHD